MESTNKNKSNKGLSVAELLCSAGYLPPRNEQDVERFEQIYKGRKFGTESYVINADAIFDKVTGGANVKTRKLRPKTNQSFLRAANNINSNSEECMTDDLYHILDKKKL